MDTRLLEQVTLRGGTIVGEPFTERGLTHVRVVCDKGHEWTSQRGHIINGSWCAKCYGKVSHTIKNLQDHAASLGGKCLSATYSNNKAQYEWECGQCSHQWKATWNNVNGCHSWCPNCKTSVRELITRAAFEENFPGKQFAKNLKAIGMELDGYCEEECLAFEHDGIQHRVRVEHFQRNEGDFEAQQMRDAKKDELCWDAWITLIRIPDRGLLPVGGIRSYVRYRLEELGYIVPPVLCSKEKFYESVRGARGKGYKYLEKVAECVQARSGVLISTRCPTRTWPVTVECHLGHEFETCYDNLHHSAGGRWCPYCCATRRKEESEVAEFATGRGYTLVSLERRADDKGKHRMFVTVQCSTPEHEPFEMQWDNFRAGKGCTPCSIIRRSASRRLDQPTQQQRFNDAGLKLLGTYTNNVTPVLVECEKDGYQFNTTLQYIGTAAREGKPACMRCRADTFMTMRLCPQPPGTAYATAKMQWECQKCKGFTTSSVKGMAIRIGKGTPCKLCK